MPIISNLTLRNILLTTIQTVLWSPLASKVSKEMWLSRHEWLNIIVSTSSLCQSLLFTTGWNIFYNFFDQIEHPILNLNILWIYFTKFAVCFKGLNIHSLTTISEIPSLSSINPKYDPTFFCFYVFHGMIASRVFVK